VVGAMMQKLPEGLRAALTDSRTKLNTQPTLNGMLDILASAKQGATVPFEVAEAAQPAGQGSAALVALPPRYEMQAVAEPLPVDVARQLNTVGHWLVAPDATGQLAAAMGAELTQRGCTVHTVPQELLADEAGLAGWIGAQREALTPLAGLLHLAPLGAAAIDPQGSVESWRAGLQLGEKSLYQLLQGLSPALTDGSQVLAASALGGGFGRRPLPPAEGLLLQGGAPGLLKSLLEERPTLRVKAVDLDPAAQPGWPAQLLDELLAVGGRQEVGYPQGSRTVFRTVEAAAGAPGADARLDQLVVLATGGARGITAEVLRELARPGNALVLTGRSALPATESADTVALDSADKLRQHFIGQVRAGAIKIGDVPRKVQAVLGEREMRQNIADFRQRGAAVEYHAVNVTREADLAALVADVRGRLGAIHGIVHGAGVIEDKLLADKLPDSWSRVVETKVIGLLLLQKLVPAADLRFVNIFSSVAGRYGNSGQSDYATANELMNRLGAQLAQRWAGQVTVRAMCWGPWGPTLFGAGMVTDDTEAKFAAKGVLLVQAAEGRRLFLDELRGPVAGAVEVVCGVGPWEQREADNGRFTLAPAGAATTTAATPAAAAVSADPSAIRGPLLGAARIEPQPTGSQVVRFTIDAGHAYLKDHAIDSKPVVPAAAALEVFAEAARALWPGWQVVELRDLRLMKGIELPEMPRSFTVLVQPPPYGSSEGFEVDATLHTELDGGRKLVHYRALIRLEQQFTGLPPPAPRRHAEKRLTVDKAYADWLFHGPQFQVIEAIKGLSTAGAAATVRSVPPQAWLPALPAGAPGWVFDPAVVDAAPQMAILWDRAFHDQTCLPIGFGRVQRCRADWPATLQMVYEALPSDDGSTVRANVSFLDDAGQVVLAIEDMRCVSSQALNRLAEAANRKVTA
jgi:NAD(P)-dependent dehydrogenase (short-subunit alcohol dehydrogenase family)